MSSHPFDRRHFLASMAGGLAGIAATGSAAAAMQPARALSAPRAPLHPRDTSGSWDDSWTQRLGQHRTVFDVAAVDAEPGVDAVAAVMDAYHEVLGTTDRELGFVLVIRHRGVPLFMSDAIWSKYDVPKTLKDQGMAASAAPLTSPARTEIARLQARGVTVLGCNRAVSGFITRAAHAAQANEDEVRREVMAGIMPGVILLPNGLFALARAQDVGCGFMR